MVQLERYGEGKVALFVLKILQDLAKDCEGFVSFTVLWKANAMANPNP